MAEAIFPVRLAFRKKTGFKVAMSKRIWLRSLKLPTLRFRSKIMLGFAVVLAVSAASMGFAYLGFDRVSAGVASYRHSVSEADLARNIDRELISYRALAQYYVATGKEDDGKAAPDSVVEMEIWDESGHAVYKQDKQNESFAAGQTNTYTFSWTPTKAGAYTVAIRG